MMLQVLFDSEQQKIVYAEAQGDFVDGLCKLLLAPHHDLVRFAGPDLDMYLDDGNPSNRASRLALSTLQESIAALDEGFFSCSADAVKNMFGGGGDDAPSDRNSFLMSSFGDLALSNPCEVLFSSWRRNQMKTAEIDSLLTTMPAKLTNMFYDRGCIHAHGRSKDSCTSCRNADLATIGEVCSALDMLKETQQGRSQPFVDRLLKPGFRFIVANNLEVSISSSITSIDLLRRQLPDAARWTQLVGLHINVDEDDFRAIARSALAGRACVLTDALGAKAAQKHFEATENAALDASAAVAAAGHFAPLPPPPPPPAQTAAPTSHLGGSDGGSTVLDGGSDKSFDMFD